MTSMGSSYIFKKPVVKTQAASKDKDTADKGTSTEDSAAENQDGNNGEGKMTFYPNLTAENESHTPPVVVSCCNHDTSKIPALHDLVEENRFLDLQIKTQASTCLGVPHFELFIVFTTGKDTCGTFCEAYLVKKKQLPDNSAGFDGGVASVPVERSGKRQGSIREDLTGNMNEALKSLFEKTCIMVENSLRL